MEKQLKVTSVRYFKTRRGLGFECKTNIKGLTIWNDGNGGGTYLDFDFNKFKEKELYQKLYELTEMDLEHFINVYEGVEFIK